MAKTPRRKRSKAVTRTPEDIFEEEYGSCTLPQKSQRAKQVAILYSGGMNFTEIAVELSMHPSTVSAIFNGDDCQIQLNKIQASDLNYIRHALREGRDDFCKLILTDLADEESPDRYQAAKLFAKIFGLTDAKNPKDAAAGSYEGALRALLQPTAALPPPDEEESEEEVIEDAEFEEDEDFLDEDDDED